LNMRTSSKVQRRQKIRKSKNESETLPFLEIRDRCTKNA
jgi:hypothetical protein